MHREGAMSEPKKPLKTFTRSGRLASIFSVGPKLVNQHIARLCVLFEDLRVEIQGIAADDLGSLDEVGFKLRQLYFLRRSICTLVEFAEALRLLQACTALSELREKLDAERSWVRAVRFFYKRELFLKQVRHDVGGHFGSQAARFAVENLLPSATGTIEVAFYSAKGGGAKLTFASEIAATALLRHLSGRTSEGKVRHLVRLCVVAYRHAVRAVDCITVLYLWNRFGR